MPEKPDTQEKKVDMIWDFCFNHLPSRLWFQDIKINFLLALLAILIACFAVESFG